MQKQVLALCFALCFAATAAFDAADTVQVVAGLLNAFTDHEHLHDLDTCIKDVEVIE